VVTTSPFLASVRDFNCFQSSQVKIFNFSHTLIRGTCPCKFSVPLYIEQRFCSFHLFNSFLETAGHWILHQRINRVECSKMQALIYSISFQREMWQWIIITMGLVQKTGKVIFINYHTRLQNIQVQKTKRVFVCLFVCLFVCGC
jgi:hypothetical protein